MFESLEKSTIQATLGFSRYLTTIRELVDVSAQRDLVVQVPRVLWAKQRFMSLHLDVKNGEE